MTEDRVGWPYPPSPQSLATADALFAIFGMKRVAPNAAQQGASMYNEFQQGDRVRVKVGRGTFNGTVEEIVGKKLAIRRDNGKLVKREPGKVEKVGVAEQMAA